MDPERRDDGARSAHTVDFGREDIEQSIGARFESRARRFPDRIAIRTSTRQVTYRQLEDRVDAIARALVAARGPRSEPIALLLNDDLDSVAATLAVLKSGKLFVVLDPAQPDARLSLILDDARAPLVVSDARGRERAQALAGAVLDIDTVGALPSDAPPLPPVSPDAHAYIVYTSGSTGRPKGVLQNHRNVLHNIFVHTQFLGITPSDRLTLLSSRGTGQAMTGIFSALLNGAALHPFDLRTRGLTGLAAWLVEDEITIYHSSASIFRELADTVLGDMTASSLRAVKLGSEPVSRKDVARFQGRFPPGCVFVNALSSTESGTIRQYRIDHDTRIEGDAVPVGYAMPDKEVMLLDETGAAVASGEVGEICVRSRYLALGYWGSPELTRQAFAADRDDPEIRLYRTGDLGRMSADGCLVCVGRKDLRVKVRGNRVEVSEIEVALLGLDAVKQVAVVERTDARGHARLVAYISRTDSVLRTRTLREHLAAKLPGHMVPAAFVFLDEFPRTPGGKIDRAALPAWQPRPGGATGSTAPRDLLETQLADIWEELLGVSAVAIEDDFFELGGDSLLAVEMAVRVEQTCGVNPPLHELGGELTIERLARAVVEHETQTARAPLTPVQTGGAQRPFVFAHGAIASDGFYCRNLARALGPDRPFYALQPHGLDGKPVPPTIERMASDRLGDLLAVQPQGPYLLGGFCAGGAIVLEMARELRRRGERVDLVVLIDTNAANARFRAWRRLVDGAGLVLRMSPAARRALFRRGRTFLRGLKRAAGRGLPEVAFFVVRKPYLVLRGAHDRNHAPAREPSDPRQAVWLEYHRALDDYVPARYSGRIVLFRSSHLEHRTPGNFAAGWQHVCESLEIHEIAGDHRTCVTTHVEELGTKIRSYLDAVP
jgi:amino acid adenylation domain-containing protein